MARTTTSVWACVVMASIGTGCKETSGPYGDDEGAAGDDEEIIAARQSQDGSGSVGYYAADAEYLKKNADFYFRVWDESFTRKLDDLPPRGEVPADKMPNSGAYYPESEGGTGVAMVGGRTPLQKYDDAFHGGQSKAAAWEREKHTNGPAWAGHCNGFAATAQRHPAEPTRNVTRGGVTFAPQDIKALLAEVYMSADYEFLGGNRCEQGGTPPGPGARPDPTVMGDCEDINPATFHAALANWLGKMRHALIMDVYSGDEVWNHLILKYEVVQKEAVTAQQARQHVTGGAGPYVYNPTAVKFAYVHTRITYLEVVKHESIGQRFTEEMELTYILEMNAAGEIVGGEWAGVESQRKHPDFLWLALEPLTPNGTRYMGNEHVDAREVIRLWAESAGFDPNRPPLDLVRPAANDQWGRWAGFEVALDGNDRGAVFGGKDVHLKVKRKDALKGAGVVLEVALNGEPLKTVTASGAEDFDISFAPGPGLGRLQFIWKRDGAVVDDQAARFVAVR